MKYFYLIIPVTAVFLSSCMSSEKAIKQGRYDQAYEIAFKKLKRNQDRSKFVRDFERAFNLVQQKDLNNIEVLKGQNDPGLWDDIFDIYSGINARQQTVRLLPELIIKKQAYRNVDLLIFDIDRKLQEARMEAAEYTYQSAAELLARGDRENSRRAYNLLQKTSKYFSDYKNAKSLMQEALHGGTSQIFIETRPAVLSHLYPSVAEDLKQHDIVQLNNRWQQYHTEYDSGTSYEYTVRIEIDEINPGNERLSEHHYMETREIQDGWNYTLDKKGNVVKDSLGNDVRTPRMVLISCAVTEIEQLKSVGIRGRLMLIDNYSGQVLRTESIYAESIFRHLSARAIGNLNALTEETRAKTANHFIPFPADVEMLSDAGIRFKAVCAGLIKKNNQHLL